MGEDVACFGDARHIRGGGGGGGNHCDARRMRNAVVDSGHTSFHLSIWISGRVSGRRGDTCWPPSTFWGGVGGSVSRKIGICKFGCDKTRAIS